MITRIRTVSADETRSVAAVMGRAVDEPVCMLLTGDYGAGKTTFVQGLARGLDIHGPVRSPSYNILKAYDNGRLPLVHVDLYRTTAQADVAELGITEMLPQGGVLAIEWPGNFPAEKFDFPVVGISFESLGSAANPGSPEEERILIVSWEDDCPIALIEVLLAFAA